MSLRPVTARAAVRLLRPVLCVGETLRCQTYAGGVVECERSGLCVGLRCSIPIGSVTGPVTRAPRLHAASRGVRAAASATRDCRGVPHVCFVFLSCYDICVSASVNAHAHKVLSAMLHTRVHDVRVRARVVLTRQACCGHVSCPDQGCFGLEWCLSFGLAITCV